MNLRYVDDPHELFQNLKFQIVRNRKVAI